MLNPPAKPVLSSPAHGIAAVTAPASFTWQAVDNAATYTFQLIEHGVAGVVYQTGLTGASYTFTSLPATPATYIWRVRAHNAAGDSPWSSWWYFTTAPTTEVPLLSVPADGAVDVSLTPTLQWQVAQGAHRYVVDILDGGTLLHRKGVTGPSYTVPAGVLGSDSTYSWRAKVQGPFPWSETWSFTTEPALPNVPVLSAPSDGAADVPLPVTLAWNTATDADSYDVQVDDDPAFASPEINQTGLATTSYQATTLAEGTAYYWRVRSVNTAGSSTWSAAWSFTTDANPVPLLLTPENGEEVTLPVLVSWDPLGILLPVDIEIADNPDFINPWFYAELSVVSWQGVNVVSIPAGTYYWHARYVGETAWSETWSFITSGGAPPAPFALSPYDGEVLLEPSVLFDLIFLYDKGPVYFFGPESYDLQVATDSIFTQGTLVVDDNFPVGDIEITTLPDDEYFWRIRSVNFVGTGSWSSVWKFTIVAPPEAPLLVFPDSAATGVGTSLVLHWQPAPTGPPATSYALQLATDAAFTQVVLDTTGVLGPSLAVTGLADSTTYYWHVRGEGAAGAGPWSEQWSFVTEPTPAPDMPRLLAPADGALDAPLTLPLVWQAPANGAIAYRIQLSPDPDFSTLIVNSTPKGQDTTHTVGPLSYSQSYYWRVKAYYSEKDSSAWACTSLVPPVIVNAFCRNQLRVASVSSLLKPGPPQPTPAVPMAHNSNSWPSWACSAPLNLIADEA